MTWPDVLRWLALIVGAAAALLAALWTLRRMAGPWVREVAREAAGEAAGEARAEVKALADKLTTNDFPHVGARIDRVESHGREDRAAMEGRLRADMVAMESRLTALIQGRVPDPPNNPAPEAPETPA